MGATNFTLKMLGMSLGACVAILGAARQASGQGTSPAQTAMESIVFITITGVNASSGKIEDPRQATGFVIDGAGHILTVNHALLGEDGNPYYKFTSLKGVFGGVRTSDRAWDLELVERKEAHDLALLKIRERPPDMRFAPLVACPKEPDSGSELIGCGFPINKGFATVKGTFNNPSGEGGLWHVTMDLSEGMSGGPIVDGNGRVRAVAKRGIPGQAATTEVIPIQYSEALAVRPDFACGRGWVKWAAGGAVATGVAIVVLLDGDDEVTLQNARFDPAEVQCRAGSVNVPLPFAILVDYDAKGKGAVVSTATLTMRVEETSQPGEVPGTEAGFPTTNVIPTELGQGAGTLRVGSELRCTNPDGVDRISNRWRGLLSVVHTGGRAKPLQTSNLLTVRSISSP